MSDEQQTFIDMVAPLAQAAQARTKVPASVTIAQAILETGWGKHTIADANNLFGIKGTGPAGSITVPTHEVVNGAETTVDAAFRKYHNIGESVEDHADFFVVNKRYAHALEVASDANSFAQEIQRAGYATDPDYAAKLISLMQGHNLYQYDGGPVPVIPPVVPYLPSQPPLSLPAPAPADPAPTDALDPEVQAMSDMLDILQGLGRKRVLTYVTARYGT
jgi:flagellum-specific peptidoglycan hydrolase FlgJ